MGGSLEPFEWLQREQNVGIVFKTGPVACRCFRTRSSPRKRTPPAMVACTTVTQDELCSLWCDAFVAFARKDEKGGIRLTDRPIGCAATLFFWEPFVDELLHRLLWLAGPVHLNVCVKAMRESGLFWLSAEGPLPFQTCLDSARLVGAGRES